MPTPLILALGLVAAVLIVAILWRLFSCRRSLPCPWWLGWLIELDNPILWDNTTRHIMRRLGLQPGMKVLDYGCGRGRLTIPAAKAVGPEGEVTALDIQRNMLERVKGRARVAGLDNIRYIHAGTGKGRPGVGVYDRVLLVTVLGEIPDRKEAMREIFDSLRPGGILSITEVIADPHFQRRGAVLKAAGSAGFARRASWGTPISYTMHFEKPADPA